MQMIEEDNNLIKRLSTPLADRIGDIEVSNPAFVIMEKMDFDLAEAADKIEGLESDLDDAVEVAFRRGAVEWVRLNYPARYAALQESKDTEG